MKLTWFLMPLLLVGCATTGSRPQPLTQAGIIALAQAGTADAEIIQQIDETRSIYRLGAADVIRLRQEGVSETVVNYMLDTYVRYAVAVQRRQDAFEYDWHYRWGYWYSPIRRCR
ncbi:MAG: hypothetical protein PCFJNLEI_01531 [Verrucomicrobiae bacterium]|nr:hypothetical protein [Verrucomicrobiae bacterium]